MPLWIGTSGFQYPEWKGKFYPDELSKARMLAFYAARFPSVESNYTFRRIPSVKTIERWLTETPETFRFSLKAPQRITHFSKLHDCGDSLLQFLKVVRALKSKLGPVLFQLPATFKKDTPLLAAFLQDIPSGTRVAFEFRHASWFDDKVYTVLRRHKAALCIAESAELVTPTVVTANFGYLRLRRENYKRKDLVKWAEFIQSQQAKWRETYIYFKHEETGVGPRFAARMQSLLGIKPRISRAKC